MTKYNKEWKRSKHAIVVSSRRAKKCKTFIREVLFPVWVLKGQWPEKVAGHTMILYLAPLLTSLPVKLKSRSCHSISTMYVCQCSKSRDLLLFLSRDLRGTSFGTSFRQLFWQFNNISAGSQQDISISWRQSGVKFFVSCCDKMRNLGFYADLNVTLTSVTDVKENHKQLHKRGNETFFCKITTNVYC